MPTTTNSLTCRPRSTFLHTILRDGSQQEGLSLSVDDKLRVAEQLDHLGVTFIEGGWPGANPKDVEFFARAQKELKLTTATLVAFGSTRRAGVAPHDDAVLANLIGAAARRLPASWPRPGTATSPKRCARHSTRAWPWSRDSIEYLIKHDLRVFLDAEHFFDGYRRNRDFALPRPRGGRRGGGRGPRVVRHQRRFAPR